MKKSVVESIKEERDNYTTTKVESALLAYDMINKTIDPQDSAEVYVGPDGEVLSIRIMRNPR